MSVSVGINGFGRFSLHLLSWWLDRREQAGFSIDFINDDVLGAARALEIINSDPYVRFDDYRVELAGDTLRIKSRDGRVHAIRYSNEAPADIPWLGRPRVMMECSGKLAEAARSRAFLSGDTKLVLISATSWDADTTLVYGFNHQSFDAETHRVISYGSCTVNGYVPLAAWVNQRFGVIDSDVHVVHNIVRHRLDAHQTLLRKDCTLERSGPMLLDFIDQAKNFAVVYSIVPWDGVSMIDYRFRLQKPDTRDGVIAALREATAAGGALAGLYGLEAGDVGPQAHNCTPYSAVFIEEGLKVRGDNVYLQAYFDTENSVNRYFDLAAYLAQKLDA